eukprot:TRINITY_DN19292_c0_g1_i1.p1 TRINITY_DN19292_c0_g1~~TRINITY_DN19292_c0_g1_i1.p1  ORF type:complete len:650 (-),score=90.95 TRINITY_DN19292_c0_g1_i1:186-2135(-)
MSATTFAPASIRNASYSEAVGAPLQLASSEDLDEDVLDRVAAVSNLQHALMAPATLYTLYSQHITQEATAKKAAPIFGDAVEVERAEPWQHINDSFGVLEEIMRQTWPQIMPSCFKHEFEPLELLGRGGFGEVWRCRCRKDQKEYAVKAVHYCTNAVDGGQFESRVIREARMWASMSDHPNIVTCSRAWVEVEGVGVSDGLSSRATEGGNPTLGPSEFTGQAPSGWEEVIGDADSSFCTTSDSSQDVADGGIFFEEPSQPPEVDVQDIVEAPQDTASPHHDQRASKVRRLGWGKGCKQWPDQKATLYIQVELCSKVTLQTWISRRNAAVTAPGGVSREESWRWAGDACDIFFQCVAALAHLHRGHCAHRDIKPPNVLFAQDGSVLLADFGLAKHVGGPQLTSGLPTGEFCETAESSRSLAMGQTPLCTRSGIGTPSYASPEQLVGGVYGVETDIFALGMLSAELLCPVSTQMERAALFQDLRHGRQLPQSVKASFPTAANLLMAMTSPVPSLRPCADDLLQASSHLLRETRCHFRGVDGLDGALPTLVRGATVRGLFLTGSEVARESGLDQPCEAAPAPVVASSTSTPLVSSLEKQIHDSSGSRKILEAPAPVVRRPAVVRKIAAVGLVTASAERGITDTTPQRRATCP